jgi:hypothetical protein
MKAPITNANIFDHDWSFEDRQKALRSIPKMKLSKNTMLAPNVPAAGIWMQDASAMDSRSVKAYLAGNWSYRVSWWHLCVYLHRLASPSASQESVMYRFHKRHQLVTLGLLQWSVNLKEVHQTLKIDGIAAALKKAIAQCSRNKELNRLG